MNNIKQKGFTLIELLVVIAVIGLLASIILVSVNSARSKARDAKRLADIAQMQKALEFYYNDHNSSYPSSGGATNGPNNAWSNSSDASWLGASVFPAAMAPYLSKLPLDPTNATVWISYQYSYYSCGLNYMLVFALENPAGHPSPGANICGSFYNYVSTGAITIGQ